MRKHFNLIMQLGDNASTYLSQIHKLWLQKYDEIAKCYSISHNAFTFRLIDVNATAFALITKNDHKISHQDHIMHQSQHAWPCRTKCHYRRYYVTTWKFTETWIGSRTKSGRRSNYGVYLLVDWYKKNWHYEIPKIIMSLIYLSICS